MDLALHSGGSTRTTWRSTAQACLSVAARMLVPRSWLRRAHAPAWADTLPSSPPAPPRPREVPSPAAELTRVLNKFTNGRTALRHLHIVEQTLHMRHGNLDLVPTAVLTKAMLQLRFLMSGARKRPGLERLHVLMQQQLFRAEMQQFVDSTRGSISWRRGQPVDIDSEFGELCMGEIVDTSRLPSSFQPTRPLGLDPKPSVSRTTKPPQPAMSNPHHYTQLGLTEAELALLRMDGRHE